MDHPVIKPPKAKPTPEGVVAKLRELEAEAGQAFAHLGATVSAEFGRIADFFRNHIR